MEKELKAKSIVDSRIDSLRAECSSLTSNGLRPKMGVVLVGNSPASLVYIRNKKNLCEKVGADFELFHLDENISRAEFLEIIYKLNKDPKITGCFVQLPVPAHLQDLNIPDLVDPRKDVDGFHFENIKDIYLNTITENTLLPCTPKGVLSVLSHYKIPVKGKNITIVGRSLIVGKPLSMMLSNLDATVTLCHSRTANLNFHTQNADIIIAAIGKPKFLNRSHLAKTNNQVIIDVGINHDENGKLCGDVDYNDVVDHVAAITPVPGGIGPLTVLSLIENLFITTKQILKANS